MVYLKFTYIAQFISTLTYVSALIFLTITDGFSQETHDHLRESSCHAYSPDNFNGLQGFIGDVQSITKEMYVTVSALEVKHDGDGDISVLIDESGSLKALRIDYTSAEQKKDNLAPTILNVDIENLNKGEKLEFSGKEEGQVPLRFYAKTPPGLDDKTGGELVLEITTSFKEPPEVVTYKMNLIKQENEWTARYVNDDNEEIHVENVKIHPGISWFKWNGTFKKVDFLEQ